jgi:NAD(P)H-dependent flavin oxidoreductase YrpB (nitropropane dioxygenase family)
VDGVKLPTLNIANLDIKYPIIQGGMAIRASMAKLAAAVANEGGVGLIAGTALSINELKEEIRKARELTKGVIGVNIMFAAKEFAELVMASIEEGIDLIVCGAGFSRDIFTIGKEHGTPIVPIVSSLKLAKISEKMGAAAIIVEGGNAGGHLGTELDSWDIVKEIKDGVKIPVIGAGGVITPEDAKRMFELGVDGIQMGSRFICAEECEVAQEFKDAYINAKEGDVVTIMSSAGLPANAIISPYVQKILNDDTKSIPSIPPKHPPQLLVIHQKTVEIYR